MRSMEPVGGFTSSFVSQAFPLSEVDHVTFAVLGLTGGSVTFEYSVDYAKGTDGLWTGNWYDLDTTNLVLTADGTRVAVWGGGHVRSTGSSAAGASLDVLIGGHYVLAPVDDLLNPNI